jgi:hypothetical protein
MSWLLWIGSFLGKLFAEMIPAIGTEIRKNNTVKQIGADDEVSNDISDHIAGGVDMHGVRMDEADDSGSP